MSSQAVESPASEDEAFLPDWKSLFAMLVLQAQNVFNTKITQFTLIGLAGVLAGKLLEASPDGKALPGNDSLQNYEQIIAGISAAAFFLVAPIGGWMADRFSKKSVLIGCLWTQGLALGWIAVCLYFHQIWLATIGFFLIEAQATVVNPAKMGICKELVGSEGLPKAIGLVQMLVMLSIIIGSIAGGQAFASLNQQFEAWRAGVYLIGALLIASLVQFLLALMIRRTPVQSQEPFRISLLWSHFGNIAELLANAILRRAALGVAYFCFLAQVTFLTLILTGKEVFGLTGEAIAQSSIFNGLVGIGIAIGSLFVAWICRKRVVLAAVPVGALGMAAGLAGAAFLDPATVPAKASDLTMAAAPYLGCIGAIGFFAAIFLVPLNAFIQDKADPERRGRVTSTVNLMNAIAGLLAIGFVAGLSRFAHLKSDGIFVVLGGLTLIVGLVITQIVRTSPHR
jgi:acyl-[acyl-carrier-protein]-phospholipid O-acyltransferase/long-chain-fatty-acid--[acyl-carrier-protein] ligase